MKISKGKANPKIVREVILENKKDLIHFFTCFNPIFQDSHRAFLVDVGIV